VVGRGPPAAGGPAPGCPARLEQQGR
jgi:hypothetical protein